ncbi:MAG: hypothetical protein ABI564_12565 [Ideonella sp.]
MDPGTLKSNAKARMQALLSTLMRGDVQLQALDDEAGWDGLLKRHLHEERFAAWHQFNELQIETDPSGQIKLFHDPRRLVDSEYAPLPDDEVLRICTTSGLIGKRVESIRAQEGPDNTLAAVIQQRHHRLPTKLQFLINCKTRQIAALRVVQEAT